MAGTSVNQRIGRLGRRKRQRIFAAVRVARARGWSRKMALVTAFSAAVTPGIDVATGMALVDWESGGRHIFGHDYGGPFQGLKVTKTRYQRLVDWVRNGGVSNGVGLAQITYGGYLLAHPSLWKPLANVKLGHSIFADYLRQYGDVANAYAHFNGGGSPPDVSYQRGRDVAARVKAWHRAILRG